MRLNLTDTATVNCVAEPLGSHGNPHFAFAQGDFHPNLGGVITVCRTSASFVISFEKVRNYEYKPSPFPGELNASIKLFKNGAIQYCYGSSMDLSYGCAQTLVGGIEDGTTKIPVAGVTDADGVFISNAFPAPGCYQKEPVNNFFVPIVQVCQCVLQ